MARRRRELQIKVHGVRRKEPDVRRLARAVLRLAVELDAEQAQQIEETLDHEDALRRRAVSSVRRERRTQRSDPDRSQEQVS